MNTNRAKSSGPRNAFNGRTFSAMLLTVALAGLAVTGYFNHATGHGRMTVERHIWMSAHNALGILFLATAMWHAAINRRALLGHLGNLRRNGLLRCRECLLACAVMALVVLFSLHARLAGG